MSWPGITDFSEAVQNPRLCFRGTDLEVGEVSLNQRDYAPGVLRFLRLRLPHNRWEPNNRRALLHP